MPDIRVLVVDDHAILRDGIRSLLDRQDGITVVGEAGNGVEALAQAEALVPDIVLMDLAMPEMDGLEATRAIKAAHPETKVLILTQHDNQEYVAPLWQAGVSGYVLKRAGGREVIAAIRQVQDHGVFLGSDVARQMLSDHSHGAEHKVEELPHLTERERQVLRLVVEGQSNKEIARILGISPKTASVHRTHIMTKLDVRNSAELVRYALQHRLLAPAVPGPEPALNK
ncbi:MAG: hypothetical protein AUK03_14060 [Anaerolineae bacterium CG2_30_64_16]|nr:MAG: hypothetical protein AUK03_14060 [Anaerolineae bacterium CG2_30_64_16]